VTVHRISARPPSLAEQLRELIGARELFRILVARDIRTRYKQTALGMAWVVLQPLVPALIFAVVLGAYGRLPSGGVPYFLFVLVGFVVFGLFSNAASRAGMAFLRDAQLVGKVYVPRPILPIAAGSATLLDFAVGLALALVLMLATGHVPPVAILLAPLVALAALVLGLGLGLAIAGLSAHYRDFAIAIPFAIQILLYASPVVYSSELIPAGLRDVYALNPLVAITESFRAAVLGTPAPGSAQLAIAAAIGAALVVLGVAIFNRTSRDLADVL
jgi:lipopolysaccharide transport system permease protein